MPNIPGLVWLIPPILEFDYVFYCAFCDFFALDNHFGMVIDREIGELMENAQHGHGPVAFPWVYDPERNVFGFAEIGPIILHPFDERFERGPRATGLVVVSQIDSSIRYVSGGGYEFLTRDSFLGRYAVMYNGAFVTDFLFDARNQLGESFLNDTVALGQDGRWGLVGRDGEVVIPLVFEHIVHNNNVAFARHNGRYGILDIRDIR